MKKLLLLHTFLFALNLGAATEQNSKPQNDTQTTEIAENAQTQVIKKTPSFLARHADKLKRLAYVTDIVFPTIFIALIQSNNIAQYFNIKEKNQLQNNLFDTFLGTFIFTTCTNIAAKYAMSKKHAFDLEALKNELTEQQAKTDAA